MMDLSFSLTDLWNIFPVFMTAGLGILLMTVDLFLYRRSTKKWLGWIAAIGTLGIFLSVLLQGSLFSNGTKLLFSKSFQVDSFTSFSHLLILLGIFLTILLSIQFVEHHQLIQGEFFTLLLFSASGMMLMTGANNLLLFFLGFEIMSISSYVLVGWNRKNEFSSEGSLKYLLAGMFATGILWFGLVFIYGSSTAITFSEITTYLQNRSTKNPIFITGFGLVFGSFAFKIAAVPFHMWAPDAYRGSPTPVMAFVTTIVKVAAIFGFIRLLYPIFPSIPLSSQIFLPFIAAATVVIGNLGAVSQDDVKSILAYSSIAHAGYVLIGLTAWFAGRDPSAASAGIGGSVLFYLFAYTFMNLGAFSCVLYLHPDQRGSITLQELHGTLQKAPYLAIAFTVFLASLTGLPPTAGFIGKLYIFRAAIDSGYLWLSLIGIGGSLMSVYYYMNIVSAMCQQQSNTASNSVQPYIPSLTIASVITLWGVLFYGLLPAHLLELTTNSVIALLS